MLVTEEVQEAVVSHFGLQVKKISALGSCQDLNFKLKTVDGKVYVIKYTNPSVSIEDVHFQHSVKKYLSTSEVANNTVFPVPIHRSDEQDKTTVQQLIANQPYTMHILSYVDGELLSDFAYLPEDTLEDFGVKMAALAKALAAYPHPIVSREGEWDMRQSVQMCTKHANSIANLEERASLLHMANQLFNTVHTQYGDKLRTQLIHGDLAPYNVVARRQANQRPYVHGVIDFGDITHTWLVAELAIAISPMLSYTTNDMLGLIARVVAGFHSVVPLGLEEAKALYLLIVLRTIVLYVSIQGILSEDPDNKYLQDELQLNKQALHKVLAIPVELGVTTVLLACRYAPSMPAMPLTTPAPLQTGCMRAIDMSTLSEIYEPGDWLNPNKSLEILTQELRRHNDVAYTLFGKVWLCNTQVRSLTSPHVMPTFSLFHFPDEVTLATLDGSMCAMDVRTVGEVQRWMNSEVVRLWVASQSISHVHVITTDTHVIHMISSSRIQLSDDGQFVTIAAPCDVLVQVCVKLHDYVSPSDVHTVTSSLCPNTPNLFLPVEGWDFWKRLVASPLILFGKNDFNHLQVDNRNKALNTRYQHVAKCQEHYFRRPPNIERGFRTFMYDVHGRAYLDMVNNVAIVGHCHEHVNNAIAKQAKLLNTNSRFIYSALSDFAEEVLSNIPQTLRDQKKLNKVFFVNSGSEATDLALRIARVVASERRARMKGLEYAPSLDRDVICIQGGYHGITTASDEVSTTLNDNPRSLETRAPWIHLVPMPNLFRGVFRANDQETSEAIALKYADLAKKKIEEMVAQGTPPSAFIAEPLSGNAGGVEIPTPYLSHVYEHIRRAGGLCICDEVQVGYGRLGTGFWGFQEHNIVPDIVTMAKAAGNGHPFGFVIVSEDIVDDFYASQGSFFSSAGGGPISCAVGKAVLEVIKQEDLQNNARVVGAYLHDQLLELQKKHAEVIGCIHGHGLYQGVELVQKGKVDVNGVPLPATKEAYAICERLLELGVINHNTGDYSNVLKIKPPLYFSKEDADFFVQALDIALQGW
eukprot:gene25952-31339_t